MYQLNKERVLLPYGNRKFSVFESYYYEKGLNSASQEIAACFLQNR
jgi:hypothetical protein